MKIFSSIETKGLGSSPRRPHDNAPQNKNTNINFRDNFHSFQNRESIIIKKINQPYQYFY
jgi:hypothetical protein